MFLPDIRSESLALVEMISISHCGACNRYFEKNTHEAFSCQNQPGARIAARRLPRVPAKLTYGVIGMVVASISWAGYAMRPGKSLCPLEKSYRLEKYTDR